MTSSLFGTGVQYALPLDGSKQKVGRRLRRLTTLRLVRECSFAAPTEYPADDIAVTSPRDVFARMAPYAERETVEVFWLLSLNAQRRLIGNAPEAVTRGILNSSLVHPREVFVYAIVARAAAIVLCHNHPSGDPTPSTDDRSVTEQLVAAGRLLDIPVMDHVVIGRDRYVSFAEAGLL
jgi:DNA repair protein RadC